MARSRLAEISLSPREAEEHDIRINQDGIRRSGLTLLSLPGVTFEKLRCVDRRLESVPGGIAEQLERDCAYLPYLERQAREISRLRQEEALPLSPDIDYRGIAGRSAELRQKLAERRPETLGEAARVEGMTPAALALLFAVGRRQVSARSG